MKIKIFLILFILINFSFLKAQKIKIACSPSSACYVLKGHLSVHMKNGEVCEGEYKIKGDKVFNKKTKSVEKLTYQDIDYIMQEEKRYEYIRTDDNRMLLLKLYDNLKNDKIAFYEGKERISFSDQRFVTYFMVREDLSGAVEFRFFDPIVKKYFSDCLGVVDQKYYSISFIYSMYTNNCSKL
ncbi:hypothetical protein [Apibacter sp. HY039]|uniref:hypothetical protein n=1 Tax=Apibacter sp. HY039 TaxID=2501476 RepID=UPI000FEBD12B|nr:hypothetical protein [Apibacter sp. HY039]